MKFKTKIVLASCVIMMLALSTLSIQQYFTVKNTISSLTANSVDELCRNVASAIEKEMALKGETARYMMSLIEDDPSDASINRIFTKTAIKEGFLLAGIGFEDDGSLLDNDPNWVVPAGYDARKRPWYKETKANNRLTFTQPYQDTMTNETLVSITVPMQQQGRFSGVMFLDLSLSKLSATINNINLFDAGYLFLLNRDNLFISHPDETLNGTPATARFGDQIDFSSNEQSVDIDGRTHLLRFITMPTLGWTLGVDLDAEVIEAAESKVKSDAILYSLMALLVAVIALTMLMNLLMKPLDRLNEAMAEISTGEGDLTQRLATDSEPEFADVAAHFNGFSDKLCRLIAEVKTLANTLTDTSTNNAGDARQSKTAIDTQLRELEQLATAMNEMASTSMEVANHAQEAAAAVQDADLSVVQGVDTVADTAGAIDNLSEQIEQAVQVVGHVSEATANIESILAVINGIADQTNLLALNAAIEAARAGEQGRGFAVVADEVRTLASRTQQSTSEIRSMIDQLQEGATSAVEVMEQSKQVAQATVQTSAQSNDALGRIRDAIKRITDMNLQIASAAEEQSLVAEDINRSTLNIKDLSNQISELAESQEQGSNRQLHDANKQEQLLGQFKV
ncbi:methyl-accepting chemotaxis sensory transducer with Cache sensor [Ferrimonas sediminum]|uniref:Methyl-accepting chemotaxis sensory transducer with Cache sensor n=1 Tax=Ferrimonas sediminum TaxID=718193 RepID=A0A1G8SFG5_9GAMM|nr:methyl-accepting chemotaxis protein [Ferrimonas sediminum]SDJ27941.1 methyl-accepting chemotaxis sensory transducer with Cache sensor [Ferrimonas sediminum]